MNIPLAIVGTVLALALAVLAILLFIVAVRLAEQGKWASAGTSLVLSFISAGSALVLARWIGS